jgi:hypothetical protein
MALRRLLSGWLIAMAALARSLALALERASEDRSAPTPDPVMAALADRYPGAPAHWLAHVAERTSQLAEVGEAPLSLNSDPAAWPSARPDGLPPPPVTPAEPEPASHQPRRPPLRRDTAVPTLAALRDRSSEVWRRPDVERPRRPRPVFAAVASAPTPERPTATTEADPAPRRPRSPLTFVGSAPQAVPDAPEPATPVPEAAPTTPPRETTWSQPPQARVATSEAAKAWTDAQQPTARPPIDPVFTSARSKDALEHKAPSDRIDAPPVVRRQRSWFFAKSRRVERSLDLPADPGRPTKIGRADTVETVAIARVPQPAFQASTTDRSVAAPDRIWQDQALPPRRRSLFQKLAALAAKPRARADHFPVSEPTEARASPPIDRPSPDTARGRSAPSFTPSRTAPSARPASAFSHPEDASPSRTKAETSSRAARRIVRGTSKTPSPDDETRVQGKRSSFSRHPQAPASRGASRGFAAAPADDRWPALPPTTFASPNGAEASPPRWDVLAREQEEGRWSV